MMVYMKKVHIEEVAAHENHEFPSAWSMDFEDGPGDGVQDLLRVQTLANARYRCNCRDGDSAEGIAREYCR